MSTRFSQKEKQKQAGTMNPPEANIPEEGGEGLSEILKEIREFCMETAGNFGVLKEEINDLREGFGELKLRADAAELRIAENEDREIGMTKVLLHSLQATGK